MARNGEKYWEHNFTSGGQQHVTGELPRRPRGTAETACKGACNAAWRRQQRLLDAYGQAVRAWQNTPAGRPPKEPETREMSPWPGDPVFCAKDQAVYRRLLAELDDLAAIALRYNDGHRKGPDSERVTGTRGAPSPSATIEELDHLASALRDWEATARDLIREHAGLVKSDEGTPARRGYLASEITTSVSWLVAHFDVLIASPAAEAFAGEVGDWHEKMKKRDKAGTGRKHMKRPCPRCDRYSLYQEDDADYVACARTECGRLMSWAEWLAWDERFGQAPPMPQAS